MFTIVLYLAIVNKIYVTVTFGWCYSSRFKSSSFYYLHLKRCINIFLHLISLNKMTSAVNFRTALRSFLRTSYHQNDQSGQQRFPYNVIPIAQEPCSNSTWSPDLNLNFRLFYNWLKSFMQEYVFNLRGRHGQAVIAVVVVFVLHVAFNNFQTSQCWRTGCSFAANEFSMNDE